MVSNGLTVVVLGNVACCCEPVLDGVRCRLCLLTAYGDR